MASSSVSSTTVPFVLPMSVTTTDLPLMRSVACRELTVGTGMTMSAGGERPTCGTA
jgi:hypothetical protein